MALEHGNGLQKWEIAVTKKLVGEFRRRSPSLAREEFDDLVQECLAHWIVVRRKLTPNPDKPPVGYMAQVIRNKLTDLMREQKAEKRAGDLDTLSLDATIDGSEDGMTLGELLADAESTAGGDHQGVDRHHARIDLARVLVQLTPAQRRLCAMLGEDGLSIKEAAERLRIPRGTLYEEIKRIRKIFADHGIGDYLKE
ncbi:RNA polymerase sigma factor, sigma-70 family, ECF subfamily [Burkholderiales bacterium GJ-E10]|nr:RNA polymerase sigma factor, sigma-70 family, ECF subfamily [Burkholderiales bacterium GJ-E10]